MSVGDGRSATEQAEQYEQRLANQLAMINLMQSKLQRIEAVAKEGIALAKTDTAGAADLLQNIIRIKQEARPE